MVEFPNEYRWSSDDIFMGKRKSDLVNDNKILSYFKGNSRSFYKSYVESKLIEINKSEKELLKVGWAA